MLFKPTSYIEYFYWTFTFLLNQIFTLDCESETKMVYLQRNTHSSAVNHGLLESAHQWCQYSQRGGSLLQGQDYSMTAVASPEEEKRSRKFKIFCADTKLSLKRKNKIRLFGVGTKFVIMQGTISIEKCPRYHTDCLPPPKRSKRSCTVSILNSISFVHSLVDGGGGAEIWNTFMLITI